MAEDSSQNPVPIDVRDFIDRYVESIAQLEALLLLHGTSQERWSAANVAKRLYANEGDIDKTLARLCSHRLLSLADGTYRFECGRELQQEVDRLEAVYSKHLVAVTNLIHSKPRRISEFADAFKFRKDS